MTSLPGKSFAQGNYNWITPGQTYLKMSVIEDGMYRITRTDFTNAGINTSGIDPRTVKLYNMGNEIPIYFSGEDDGVFNSGDYFDFHGKRSYGGNTKYYNVDNNVYYTKDEYYTMYSDTNAYWVAWGGANGTRYTDFTDTSSVPFNSDTFTERFHFERDRVYTQGERAGSTDFRYFNNELFQGEGWYWSWMYNGLFLTENFLTPNLPDTPKTCTLSFFAYPADVNYSVFNEHRIVVYINNTSVANEYRNDFNYFNKTVTFSTSLLRNDTVNRVSVYYLANGYDGHTYLDYVDIKIPSKFRFKSGKLSADLGGTDSTVRLFTMSGFEDAPLLIYDVKNYKRIVNYTTSFDTLFFAAKSNSTLEVINSNILKKPFRIAQRQVANLVTSSNGADYIIVHHPNFQSQAQQLANYRASADSFRVFTAKITDIYDVFNYGIENPLAVRLFTKNAYDTWPGEKFRYLCLFGRGSLDPKKNSTTTLFEKNLIPVYGNPTTDNYFANFNIGGFSYLEKVAVGRLPAYTTTEAQAMVDNIIAYENQSPAEWMKNVLFVVGGGTAADQQFNQSFILPFISNYVLPPPFSGDAHKAFRVDSTTTVTYNYKDSVRRDINNGDLIVNFQGHAGFANWEDAMQEPSTLDNYGKLPFVWSMTCYTGRNADNTARVFGEKFVTMNNKGAIGFLGSTGWGFVFSGSQFHDNLFEAVMQDTIRRTGDIIKFGKEQIAYDTVGSVTRHTVNCYVLLGDPAVKLALPTAPEFHFDQNGYRLSDDFPSLNEFVTLTVYPKNYGLHSDSCKIGFALKIDNSVLQSRDTVLRSLKFSDSVRFTFRLDSIQNYSVEVLLDKDNWIQDEDESDNELSIDIPMKNNSFVQLRPVDNERIESDSVELTCLNPLGLDGNVRVLLQLDTLPDYSSPALMTFMAEDPQGLKTKFNAQLPVSDSNALYFWRTNTIVNGDSAGWTNSRTFSTNASVAVMSSKGIERRLYDTVSVQLRKFDSRQFAAEDLFNTLNTDTGIILNRVPLNLYVRSMGSSGAEVSHFFVNDKAINIDGGRSTGLNMLKVNRITGNIIQFKNFKLLVSQSIDSLMTFLNSFDSTHYLMGLNASYVDYNQVQQLTPTAKQKIRDFGSTKIDSMFKFGYFDTWSFIGYLGASQANVSEQYFKYTVQTGWRESQSTISSTCLKPEGTFSNVIGPSSDWSSFAWTKNLAPFSDVVFDVIGIDRTGAQTLLIDNVSSNESVLLDTLDEITYPYLGLVGVITADTTKSFVSAVFKSIQANYSLPSELVLETDNIELTDTAVSVGKETKVYFNVANVGFQDVEKLTVNAYMYSLSASNLLSTDTISIPVLTDTSARVSAKFRIPYYRTRGDGKIPVMLEVQPVGANEFYAYNNSVKIELNLNAVGTESLISLYSDDILIKGGEQVSSNPVIRIEYKKPELTQHDSRKTAGEISLAVNGMKMNAETVREKLASRESNTTRGDNVSGSNSGTLLFQPALTNGRNKLSVTFVNSTGETDSVSYDVIVSDINSVTELNNFPNPMNDRTTFVFNVSGSFPPEELTIRIYTTAGRLIRELRHLPTLGYNQVEWDGRDTDGDNIANGTYLYKLMMRGGEDLQTAVQKLVVLR